MVVFVLSACRSGEQKDESLQTSVKVLRYDRLQYEATVMNSVSALQKMNIDCPQATKLLIEDVLGIGSVAEPDINDRLCAYYSDSLLVRLMDDVQEKFKDLSGIEADLTKGFRNLKREVPAIPVPRIYSQISALNQSVVVGDSLLGFPGQISGTGLSALQTLLLSVSAPVDGTRAHCTRLFYFLSVEPVSFSVGRRAPYLV